MTTINDLVVSNSFSPDDKFPMWSNANGVTRSLPLSVLTAGFLQPSDIALIAASPSVETFTAGVNFTPGVSLTLSLAGNYLSAQNIEVHFDAAYQGPENYSLVLQTLTFTSPIPVGVSKVYVRGGVARLTGGPSNGTVGTLAIIDGAVTASKAATGTGKFWTTDSPAGQLWKLSDRVLVGAATAQNGAHEPTNTQTWVGASPTAHGFMTYFDTRSQMEVASTIGGVGGAFASRSSDDNRTGELGTIGVASYALNDNTNLSDTKSAWAYYGHAAHAAGNRFTACMEVDIANMGSTVECNPYVTGASGTTVGHWVGVGGETAQSGTAVNPASAAIAVVSTASNIPTTGVGALFQKGLVFGANALSGSDGSFIGGKATAVEMALGHQIVWRSSGGANAIGGLIRSDNNNANTQTRLLFGASQFMIAGTNADLTTEIPLFVVPPNQNAVNYGQLNASSTGLPVTFAAQGADANIDLQLQPKGAGVITFGTYTAGAVSQAGYITIKDASGTVRRLLVG